MTNTNTLPPYLHLPTNTNTNITQIQAVYSALHSSLQSANLSTAVTNTNTHLTPNQLFLASLTALEGTITNHTHTSQVELLLLLQGCMNDKGVKYEVLLDRFPLLSRVLRALCQQILGENRGGIEEGWNARLKQVIGCASAGLIGLYTFKSCVRVEAAMKLLDALLGLCFPDIKIPPKIRRHAHSCTIGLLSSTSSSQDVIGDAIGGYIGVLLQGMCDEHPLQLY